MNFWNLNKNEKSKNPAHNVAPALGPRPRRLGLAQLGFRPTARHRGVLVIRSPCPVCWRWCGRRGLSGGLGAARSTALESVRKGLCDGHDEGLGDSPYEAGDVR
jgi:hypothetical protein